MTYSIVARDRETGALGVATQSHFFGVGRVVPWAEAGVGAVATQSFVEVSYGPRGLALMREGRAAGEALAALVAEDPGAAARQVAFADSRGNVASHTGTGCVAAACARGGDGVSVQGNMLADDGVCDAMLAAFDGGSGDLVERLLAALDGAEAAGGDVRGRQSAALLVVRGARSERPWDDVVVDVRVDDHPDPLPELRRLAAYNRFYNRLLALLQRPGLFSGHLAASADEIDAALDDLEAGQALLGENQEAALWRAVLLARSGRTDEACAVMRGAIAVAPGLGAFVRRLPAIGTLSPELASALVGER
jgi:uncharacterized Ntn-hydrolase superfamily protein